MNFKEALILFKLQEKEKIGNMITSIFGIVLGVVGVFIVGFILFIILISLMEAKENGK